MQPPTKPVFIHSLFRAGSTWLFDRFRRAAGGRYYCYQEPFHDVLIGLADDAEALRAIHYKMGETMRHPPLEKPYFEEILAIREAIGGGFKKCISYDSFFDPAVCPAFDDYVGTLLAQAPATPVLQCCRSFGRVAHLQRRFGGRHLHLWRNPWDQWWSYQVDEYFDRVTLAILHADNPPDAVRMIRNELGKPVGRWPSFAAELDHLRAIPFPADERYFAFYGLWLFSLLENAPLCDADINIDLLTADVDYAAAAGARLQALGIVGVDVARCRMPRATFTEADRAFFDPIERHVHRLFLAAGYAPERVEDAVRRRHAAYRPEAPERDALVRDAERARATALRCMRLEAKAAERPHFAASPAPTAAEPILERAAALRLAELRAREAEMRAERWARAAQRARTRLGEALERARRAEASLGTEQAAAADAASCAAKAEAARAQMAAELSAVRASHSWRVTAPARWVSIQVQLLRRDGAARRGRALARKIVRHTLAAAAPYSALRRAGRWVTDRAGLTQVLLRVHAQPAPPPLPHEPDPPDPQDARAADAPLGAAAALPEQARRIAAALRAALGAGDGRTI